tara:strand:+ start:559 stop:765 length:207 start_codon:yes stop_codon:yes gene_type:complete
MPSNKITMVHMDTDEVIQVELGKTSWVARKIIQDHEVLGYRFENMMDALRTLKSLDTINIGEDIDESD